MRAGDFVGAKIYRKPTEDKRTKKDGTPRSPKKLGKIHFPVFTPGGTRVVGFMVRQSDIAGMIERPDRFVALDAIGVYEGAVAVDDVKGTYDAAAAKRLDINLDDCIIWVGMDVRRHAGAADDAARLRERRDDCLGRGQVARVFGRRGRQGCRGQCRGGR